jgi:hypothetical protein
MLTGSLRGLAWLCAGCGLVAAGGWTLHVQAASAGKRPEPPPAAEAPSLPDTIRLPAPAPDPTAAGTFLGMPDEFLLERLRHAPVQRIRVNTGGSSVSLRLQFADGSRAAFKPRQIWAHSIPRKEIAAYRINRALGLNGVPPAVARTLLREQLLALLDPRDKPLLPKVLAESRFAPDGRLAGEASYWIPVIQDADLESAESIARWSAWLAQDGEIGPGDRNHAVQISAMIVFDFLVNNADRFSGSNTLGDERLDRLFFMDNTMSFGIEPQGHANALAPLLRVERFSRRLVGAARSLTAQGIRRALAAEPDAPFRLLADDEIAGVIARRDFLLQRVAELSTVHGENRVLCFE